MKRDEELHRQAVEAFVKMANSAAEHIAQSTGAPYAVVLLAGGGGPLVAGCWVPDPEIARKMLTDALEALNGGPQATVRDLRKEPSS